MGRISGRIIRPFFLYPLDTGFDCLILDTENSQISCRISGQIEEISISIHKIPKCLFEIVTGTALKLKKCYV
jgi:hypothetical protein